MVADLKFTPSSWSKYPCYKTVHCVLWKLKYVCLLYAVRSGNLDSWGYDAVLCSVLRTVYCSIFFLSFLIPFPPVSARYTAFFFSFLTPFSDWHDVTTTTTFPMPLYVSARWSKKWMKREWRNSEWKKEEMRSPLTIRSNFWIAQHAFEVFSITFNDKLSAS